MQKDKLGLGGGGGGEVMFLKYVPIFYMDNTKSDNLIPKVKPYIHGKRKLNA